MNNFSFQVNTKDSSGTQARTGTLQTAHGSFSTPVFMPVGTHATVKTMAPRELTEVGTTILLGNTYHLAVRPGEKLIREFGGLHRFMAWNGPILTDSGGFQVFSLASLRKLSDDGVTFRSHIDGDLFVFTPERVMEIQRDLGSDIVMPLDHCIEWPCSHEEAKEAVRRTLYWIDRAKNVPLDSHQSLFGIVQGSCFADLRKYCTQELVEKDLPGYAIGGLAVGESKEMMDEVLRNTTPDLPEEKPRYLMGVGMPEDLVMAIAHGVDMFDCVIPTRNARGGGFFTWQGKKQIRNACYRDDPSPLDPDCPCYACQTFSRGYLRHLFSKKIEEILALHMITLHNLTFYHELMKKIREAIEMGQFQQFYQTFLDIYRREEQNEKSGS